MIKEFILQGLDCPNCAAKIERSVSVLENASNVSVNFMTTTLRLEIPDSYAENIQNSIERVVHKYEPDVIVVEKTKEKENKQSEKEKSGIFKTICFFIGVTAFVLGIIFEWFLKDTINEYVTLVIFIFAYVMLGGEVIIRAGKNILKGQIFDENFLMTIASLGAFIIGEHAEAAGVMLFYQVGEFFQDMAVDKSKKSIAKLMDIRPDFANLKNNGDITKVSPDTINPGDIIIIKPGEKVPLDGVVISGESMLDTTALTGESIPRRAAAGDTVLSGSVNQSGLLTVEVTKPFGESTVKKIIELVESAAAKKAPVEKFITKFARYYTPVVVAFAALIAIVPPLLFNGIWFDWLNRGLIFLVISCPCALVISVPIGFLGGIGKASKKGILIKGGNYLEALNNLELAVFDKTGTLTKGIFKVTSVKPANGFTPEKLLELAANAEMFSNHPIALSILREYGKEGKTTDKNNLSEYKEIAGHGVSVNFDGEIILAGNKKLMEETGIAIEEPKEIGTKVYIAFDGKFAGCIVISDEIKSDSINIVSLLKSKGVRKTVMLTGDDPVIAKEVAEKLNIDVVYGGLLPHEKVEKLEELRKQKRKNSKLAFVGDGINDAPVLAMADIGVSMGGLGSDAAIEAADIVLMTDEPSKLSEAVDIAKFTNRIVWQNIIFALGLKFIFLLLGALGVATMWEAVFADVGVCLLAVLNSMRAIK